MNLPCGDHGEENQFNVFEISLENYQLSPKMKGEQVVTDISLDLDVVIRELLCPVELETVEQIEELVVEIKDYIEDDLRSVITTLQDKKIDVINVGHEINMKSPSKWKEIKGDWDDLFAKSEFVFDISIDIEGSGIIDYTPFVKFNQ
ncbi:Ger(x)C family spore germination C-terminal domain-containing protein [Alkalihalobacillus sp. 1P02AB]|uniref:Ger(x)C family spore germination C-terminal domain-containing protein n=1 Tax=Alkalihalobacillus sp. 1P02AB TaxID=3132260 RepID=UPI0039A52F01